jgi:hypothetical protein
VKDFLILGPDPSHVRGRSFEEEAVHGVILSRDRVGSEEKVKGLALFPSRKESERVPRRGDSRVLALHHGSGVFRTFHTET